MYGVLANVLLFTQSEHCVSDTYHKHMRGNVCISRAGNKHGFIFCGSVGIPLVSHCCCLETLLLLGPQVSRFFSSYGVWLLRGHSCQLSSTGTVTCIHCITMRCMVFAVACSRFIFMGVGLNLFLFFSPFVCFVNFCKSFLRVLRHQLKSSYILATLKLCFQCYRNKKTHSALHTFV